MWYHATYPLTFLTYLYNKNSIPHSLFSDDDVDVWAGAEVHRRGVDRLLPAECSGRSRSEAPTRRRISRIAQRTRYITYTGKDRLRDPALQRGITQPILRLFWHNIQHTLGRIVCERLLENPLLFYLTEMANKECLFCYATARQGPA